MLRSVRIAVLFRLSSVAEPAASVQRVEALRPRIVVSGEARPLAWRAEAIAIWFLVSDRVESISGSAARTRSILVVLAIVSVEILVISIFLVWPLVRVLFFKI